MNTATEGPVAELFGELERAWNDADGTRFGEPFADDADFVDIRGTHHTGRQAIADGHDAILHSIYEGSTIRYELISASEIAAGCALAIATATLDAPGGPLQGRHRSTITALATRDGGGWRLRTFHNTLVTA